MHICILFNLHTDKWKQFQLMQNCMWNQMCSIFLFFSFVFSFQEIPDIFLEVPVRLYPLYQRCQQHLIKTSLFKERAKVIKPPPKTTKTQTCTLATPGVRPLKEAASIGHTGLQMIKGLKLKRRLQKVPQCIWSPMGCLSQQTGPKVRARPVNTHSSSG